MKEQEEKTENTQEEMTIEEYDRLISKTKARIRALKKLLRNLDEDQDEPESQE